MLNCACACVCVETWKYLQYLSIIIICSGGIELIFNGSNLNVVQNPLLVINDPDYLDNTNVSSKYSNESLVMMILSTGQMTSCIVINSTAISCVVPPLTRLQPGDVDGLNYTIIMDNAPGPDLTNENLQIRVAPNPVVFGLVESEYNTGTSAPIRIRVSFHTHMKCCY